MKVNMFACFPFITTCFNLILWYVSFLACEEFCLKDACSEKNLPNRNRYLLYDINPPEGFNLRRDVYMRLAVLTHKMANSKEKVLNSFKLVLPPWSNLVHWRHSDSQQYLPWSLFFDIPSLQKFAPVIEMHQFFGEIDAKYSINIEEVYILQHDQNMFDTGNFHERYQTDVCHQPSHPTFFLYENMTSNNITCLSFHGSTNKLLELLRTSSARSVLIDHSEVVLHEYFGDKLYWMARRSMRFNKDLQQLAIEFRKQFLNSTDESDNTLLPGDWTQEKAKRSAKGGPYIAVHLRRRDFVKSRPKETPSLKTVAKQIVHSLNKFNLSIVFLATDAPKTEYEELATYLPQKYKIHRYIPSRDVKKKFKDGGIAIIDQIICSHARYFIGTYESTFSFRIQEEREILGFPVENTFNSLCSDSGEKCQKPSVWKIVY